MRTQILIQASMAETITEKSNPKIVLNDSVIENDQQLVKEKSQESADEEDENGEEIQFEIPEDLTSEADEAETEVQIEVVTETKLQDRTQDGIKVGNNSAESVKNKVVKMRGVEDYLGKNDLTKYENRKDSVTRLDNKIEKSSDQSESSDLKDLKQHSKNIQLHEIEKSKKSEVQNSEVRESAHPDSEMFYEDEIEDGRIPLCKFSL